MICPYCGRTNSGEQITTPYCNPGCVRDHADAKRRAGGEPPHKPMQLTQDQWDRLQGGKDV